MHSSCFPTCLSAHLILFVQNLSVSKGESGGIVRLGVGVASLLVDDLNTEVELFGGDGEGCLGEGENVAVFVHLVVGDTMLPRARDEGDFACL